MMRYEIWLGLRYLFAKRKEQFASVIAILSIGGVALGVMALLIVLPIMSGFQADLKKKLVGINSHLIIDNPQGVQNAESIIKSIESKDEVLGVSPFVTGQAILQLSDRAIGVMIRGVDLKRESTISSLRDYLVEGKFPSKDNEIIIGSELGSQFQMRPGQRVKIISPADGRTHELVVSGIFRSGMYVTDISLVGVTISRAQNLYHLGDLVSGIGIKLRDLESAPKMQSDLQEEVGAGYTVKTWMDLYPVLFGAIRMEKKLMFLLLLLIVVVAALNIASMLIMIVIEKTKEIGILRSLGATRRSVALMFFTQGAAVAYVGICLGVVFGLCAVLNINEIVAWLETSFGVSVFPSSIYYFDAIPVQINPGDVVWVVVSVLLLSLLAGTYPALRAARLIPADAIRYE